MNPVSPIRLNSLTKNLKTFTNPYPLQYDPYNTPYESVNWAETYQYYPPNGIRYINPFQRRFAPTNTEQLKVPYVIRTAATSISTLSLYNEGPFIQ